MEHSSASHAAGAVVPSTSASAGERGPAQAAGVDGKHAVRPLPELPHMPMNPIPMKVIAGRMIQASYSNMQRVIKDLAHDVPDKRQRGLLDWAMEEHHEMKKLLVLMRCSRKAKDWQKLMNMHGYLDRQSACVEGAGRGLQAMVAHLKQFVETPAPDMQTAVDIIRNRTYTQLPSVMKDALPKQPLSREETLETLTQLEDIIHERLELEIVPDAMRSNMVVEKGCVTFRVDDMFQLSLTPAGGDMNLPWRIVELEFLVQSTDASSGLVTGLLDHQKFTILQRAQVLLEQVQKRNAKGPSLPSNANSQIPADVGKFRQSGGETSDKKGANLFSHTDATDEAKRPKKKRKVEITKPQAENGIFEGGAFNHDPSAAIAMDVDGENLLADPKPRSKKSRGKKGFKQIRWVHNPFPILYLYEFLESLLTRLQFRIAAAQAHSLARNRWRNYLKVVEGKGREAFEVHFWDMPIPGPDPKTVPAGYQPPHKYYVLEVEVKVDQPTSNLLFERWAKKRKRTMLAHLSPEHMRYKMFGPQTRPRTYLQLRCHSVLPNLEGKLEIRDFMNPETKELLPLRLNPSSIDLGELLHNITQLQSRYIIHQLRNMVTGKPNNHGLRSVQWNSAARQRRNAIPSDVVQRWHPMVHSVPSSEQRPSYTQTCTDEARVTEAKRPDSESVHGSLKVTTFAEGDVDLSEWRPDANTDHCVARLSVRMNKSSTAIVNIDAWSGRIILRHTGRPETSSHMPFLPILEQRLNDGPNEAPEIFSFMRRAALIEELLFACQRLGLVATTLSPLQPTEESKINPSLPINKLYIRIAGLKEAWILIAVASSRDWIPEHWNIPEEIAHQGERSRQQNEPLYRVWLIETSSDGQAMIRLGRAKKEMNRRIRRITPIRVSEVFSGDSVEEYRGTWPDHLMHNEGSNSTSRDSTTSLQSMLSNDSMGTDLTQSSSGASADRRAHLQYCWDCVDMETVVSIERMCRLQHVYSTVVENLRHCGLPYEYVSLSGDEYISPDELANEESRVAGRGLKLLVGRDELAAVLSRNGEDTRTMFDDLYISVQPSRSKGFKSASNAAPNTRVPDGEPCDAYGVRVIGICGIAGAIPASMFTTQDVSGDFWTFNREQKALYFSFDTEDSIASCVELMLDTLRSNAAVALLAQKAARDKGRLEQIGVTIEPFDFRRLSFTYQKSLRVELLAKSSPDAGHPGALPIGGQNDQQWEFTSLVGEKQLANETNMRLVPPELISQIKPVWLEFIRLEKDIATAFLVLWHMAPLLRLVHRLQTKRGALLDAQGVGDPTVCLTLLDLRRIQLLYSGRYAVELVLLRSSHFGLYDAVQLPRRGVNRRFLEDPRDVYKDLDPIPLFNGLVKNVSKLVRDPSIPIGTTAIPVHFGLMFDAVLLDRVFASIDNHLNNVGLLLWLESEAQRRFPPTLEGPIATTSVDLPLMKANIRTISKAIVLKVNPANKWEVTAVPFESADEAQESAPGVEKQSGTPPSFKEQFVAFADMMARKLNGLPRGTDLRPFLLFFLDFLTMPPVLVSNFLQIAIDEQTAENDVFSLEWSFFIPPGAPAFVGPPGTPATQIEWDTRRISVLLRGYDKRTNETVLAPMRYNWATGVLGRWRAGSMQDDMTSVPEINSFMTQAMQYNYHNNDLGGLLSKLTLNSNVSIVKKSKLASLIRISAKQCRKEGVRYLQ